MSRLRIIMVDDHALFRAGLKMLLESQPDLEIVGEAASAQEGLRLARNLSPDLALIDISLPGEDGLQATQQMVQECPSVKVIILTMHDTREYLNKALQAGAMGYVPKKAADIELIAAIRAVVRGELFVHSSLTRSLLREYSAAGTEGSEAESVDKALSPRELEVLQLIALGYPYRQIAAKLFLSVKTVETYRARIMSKLNLQGRAELVDYALRHGLLKAES